LNDSGAGQVDTRPRWGFSPTRWVQAAGMRIEPAPSEPTAAGTSPAATAAAEPPEEPPGPDPDLPPAEQLDAALDRFLDFVEQHAAAYMAIFRSRGGGDAEIEATLEQNRQLRLNALIDSLASWEAAPVEVERTPLLETALQGWVFFVEGAVLRWLERRDVGRDELRQLLQQALIGALVSASEYGAEHR
jgi:hypothetical protein